MKTFLIIISILIYKISYCQDYGIYNGLAVKVPYNQMINESNQQSNDLRQAYLRFKQRYYNAVELNNSSLSPLIEPSSGWATVSVISNGGRHVEKGSAYIDNGVITNTKIQKVIYMELQKVVDYLISEL